MSDQCKHCTTRGDFDRCLKTECFHHENWISGQWRSKVARLEAENAELMEVLDIIAKEALSYQRRTGRTVLWLEMAMGALDKAKA